MVTAMNLMDALIKNKYSSANESVVSAADLHEEERKAYLNFVETRSDYDKDEQKHAKERCLDSKLAILRNKIAKGIDADLATKFEEVKLQNH